MKIRKTFLVMALVTVLFSARAFSQQITKFGVVDTTRIYQTYYRDSAPVRKYEAKKSAFQNEIDKIVKEIQTLHDKKLKFIQDGNDDAALRIDAQIEKKTEYLQEYTNAKNQELKKLEKSLQNNDEFYKKLYDTLERVAESGGYSMILSLQQSQAILWYSPSVDLTDEVISRLGN